MSKTRTQGAKRTRDQSTVVLEGLRSDFKVFGEGLSAAGVKIDRMEPKVDQLTEDMVVVKAELRLIRNELKAKVDRDEFQALEERVEALEKRVAVR